MPGTLLIKFIRSLQSIDYTRKQMEKLCLDYVIVARDRHSVYEALFLRAVTSFEVFLGYEPRRVSVRMKSASTQAPMDILLQGERYMTWLPFSQTAKRALIYLKDCKSFSELTGGDKSMIRIVTKIRNSIAHRNPHATNEFKWTL